MRWAVQVPPGAHRIVWSYRPRSVYWGLAMSAVGLVGVSAYAIGVARSVRP